MTRWDREDWLVYGASALCLVTAAACLLGVAAWSHGADLAKWEKLAAPAGEEPEAEAYPLTGPSDDHATEQVIGNKKYGRVTVRTKAWKGKNGRWQYWMKFSYKGPHKEAKVVIGLVPSDPAAVELDDKVEEIIQTDDLSAPVKGYAKATVFVTDAAGKVHRAGTWTVGIPVSPYAWRKAHGAK